MEVFTQSCMRGELDALYPDPARVTGASYRVNSTSPPRQPAVQYRCHDYDRFVRVGLNQVLRRFDQS
jgi:hypothetical protein